MDPEGTNDGVKVHGSICIAFENDVDRDPLSTDMVIGFCFSSHNPYEVLFTFQNGNLTYVNSKSLPFRVDQFKLYYRIEWKPDSISWYISFS